MNERSGIDRFFVIGGYGFTDDPDPAALAGLGLPYIGRIAQDDTVARMVLAGKCLLQASADSPAYRSVGEIVGKALFEMQETKTEG